MAVDTHGSKEEKWIGFDLDGTLAKYDEWKGIEHIGDPVPSMVLLMKLLHAQGTKVKILTARVAPRNDGEGGDKAKRYIEKWCEKNLGFVPEITHLKDAAMGALFDDRAVAVEQNTGKVLGGWPDFLPKASEKTKRRILERSSSIRSSKEKTAGVTLSGGSLEDVRKIFDSLSYADRSKVAPKHPDYYGGLPPDSRVVAYDNGRPVAFADLFDSGRYAGEGRKGIFSTEIAVADEARRKGIGRKVAIKAIGDLIKKRREDEIRDIVWSALRGNKASMELAKSIGFDGFGGVRFSRWVGHLSPEDFKRIHSDA